MNKTAPVRAESPGEHRTKRLSGDSLWHARTSLLQQLRVEIKWTRACMRCRSWHGVNLRCSVKLYAAATAVFIQTEGLKTTCDRQTIKIKTAVSEQRAKIIRLVYMRHNTCQIFTTDVTIRNGFTETQCLLLS